MRPETNASLRKERISLIELHEKESSKAKALRIAAETITDQPYDYVLILDADNLISPCYLQELNKAVSQGIKAIQTHRKAKKYEYRHSPIGCRHRRDEQFHLPQGTHTGLGDFHLPLPAPEWLSISDGLSGTSSIPIVRAKTKNWKNSCSVKAFTIEYIDTLETLDEKVRQPDALRNQRRRWIATQLFLALKMGRNLPQPY